MINSQAKFLRILWRGYKLFLSPIFGDCCRFYPTCSQYFMDSVMGYGLLRGSFHGLWRLVRCNPFSAGGYDPSK